jgi:ABC-2 type transport system permease protein
VGVVALVAFTVVGSYIFYNTNVLNAYETTKAGEQRLAEYEKKYKQYESIAQPRITDVTADVDIYPEERRVVVRGTYALENRSGEPISQLHITLSPELTVRRLDVPGTIELEDRSYRIYRLNEPMQPGARFQLPFEVAIENEGFRNDRGSTAVVYNGSFFNNYEAFPTIGYVSASELQDRSKRRKYGLDPIQRMPKISDEAARQNNYISRQADWINFRTTVSTSADQIALAPGYLQKEWVENGRRYFHYEMDSPILGFWAYLSARWEVRRDQWNGVAIEVYYDSKHPYNVDRMIDGVKKSLDYFTANFGPYQHRQVRIVEFPRYARFAQAFPNTIPFSESIGFIANLKDEEAIDYVFYVTAHEVAHQWWAHQVIGANVQGATVLSETLSQYSALMVMEKEYGPEKMRRFLKYELDHYLQGRGGELVEELPLYLVENQPYIHYRKGSVVMYALRDAIGEDRLNEALRNFRDEVAFQQPPYTTSLELLAHLRKATPPDRQQLLSDLFERIVLYDIRATDVTYRQRADGRYVVLITGEGRKFESDGKGVESELELDDWIDIAVLGETQKGRKKEETVLFLEKRRLNGPQLSVEVVVDQLPVRAGFDPFNKMIDRNPDDNVKRASAGR